MQSDTLSGDSVQKPAASGAQPTSAEFSDVEQRADAKANGPDRRRMSWKTITRGMFAPRREVVRRASDAPSAYVDFHERHLLVVAALVLCFSFADGMISVFLNSMGNIDAGSTLAELAKRDAALVACVKWLLTALAVVLLILFDRRQLLGRIRGASVLYGMMIGYGLLVAYGLGLSWMFI